ncbi:hypothetical protein GOP47_0030407 [Adiantum capillus-veneris]|nr:hypothetical protein GOP47_0030407 [Adiantum capillus-veneris]
MGQTLLLPVATATNAARATSVITTEPIAEANAAIATESIPAAEAEIALALINAVAMHGAATQAAANDATVIMLPQVPVAPVHPTVPEVHAAQMKDEPLAEAAAYNDEQATIITQFLDSLMEPANQTEKVDIDALSDASHACNIAPVVTSPAILASLPCCVTTQQSPMELMKQTFKLLSAQHSMLQLLQFLLLRRCLCPATMMLTTLKSPIITRTSSMHTWLLCKPLRQPNLMKLFLKMQRCHPKLSLK